MKQGSNATYWIAYYLKQDSAKAERKTRLAEKTMLLALFQPLLRKEGNQDVRSTGRLINLRCCGEGNGAKSWRMKTKHVRRSLVGLRACQCCAGVGIEKREYGWRTSGVITARTLPSEDPAEMKVVAAYLLAVLGGNTQPSADDIKCILESVGAEVDDGRIDFLLSETKGRDVTELIAAGREKFASVPSGGGVAAVPVAVAGGGGAGAAPAAEEPKKEEKVEEKEESDDDMGFSLFD
ncbi:60S acidic ribosomal protein [Musa troglodytarum]|uniref:60S acidic ribosomal protein n=1 Tax=Musa troglodytarum TaxID=320322 RepID=A0A9E7GWY1_9LILI|nr:60S acidic ribosomal protein [Musa troglodytarum]